MNRELERMVDDFARWGIIPSYLRDDAKWHLTEPAKLPEGVDLVLYEEVLGLWGVQAADQWFRGLRA